MKKILFGGLICLLVLGMTACGGNGAGSGSPNKPNNGNGKLGVKFVTPTTSSKSVSRSITDQKEEIQGMYYGQMTIAAYQHSPGFQDLIDRGNDAHGNPIFELDDKKDWVPFTLLGRGHIDNESMDFVVLFNGGEVDFSKHSPTLVSLSDKFKSIYDTFSVDLLEIYVYSSAVVFKDRLFGVQSAGYAGDIGHPLRRYPDMVNFPTYAHGGSGMSMNIEGFSEAPIKYCYNYSIIFARSDWFPEPVLVQFEDNWPVTKPFTVAWSNKALTSFQKEILESWATNRSYSDPRQNLIIIPYDGPTKLAVNEGSKGMQNAVFNVSFDFTQMLTDETYYNINNAINGNTLSGLQVNDATLPYENKQLPWPVVCRLVNSRPFGLKATVTGTYEF